LSEDVTIRECHQYNKDTRGYVEAVEARHSDAMNRIGARFDKELTEVKTDLKTLVDRMINRLPPWVTAVISILTLAVGILASIAFK
jgi:hypothetical protein